MFTRNVETLEILAEVFKVTFKASINRNIDYSIRIYLIHFIIHRIVITIFKTIQYKNRDNLRKINYLGSFFLKCEKNGDTYFVTMEKNTFHTFHRQMCAQ